MRAWGWIVVLSLPATTVSALVACSSKSSGALGGSGGGDDASTTRGGSDAETFQTGDDSGGTFSGDGGSITTEATDCKAGHYTGTFAGSYTSYLTFIGIPLPVTGDVQLDIAETTMQTAGEFATTTYSIANGTISGFADGIIPYHCDMVGTLDCNAKKLVGGGLRNCWYCLGLFVSTDGGNCGVYGHFEGPLNADYNGKTFSFTNGTWNGVELVTADDGGTSLPDGGGVNDAGEYVGPGNFGGSGTWGATFGNGDP